MQRRSFIQLAGISVLFAGSGLWGCAPPARAAAGPTALPTSKRWPPLLLIELNGGNDGLNTLVPYSNPRYYGARPSIAIPRHQVLQLTDDMGLHPAMNALMATWDAGQLAMVQGVGYPQPNRSHFRSIEIWETGSNSDQDWRDGWLDRTFQGRSRQLAADGIAIGKGSRMGPLAGASTHAISMLEPQHFLNRTRRLNTLPAVADNPALTHVVKVQNQLIASARQIETRLQDMPDAPGDFPQTLFAFQLKIAARLLAAEVPVAVLKVTHGSFDTHAGQPGTHERLLRELAEGLAAFRDSMMQIGRWNDLLVMTYSEFGRRVAENASAGTDHGTAAPHVLMGGRVKGGLHGTQPSLETLDEGGDMVYTTDFRQLYNTVAQRWWSLDPPFDASAFPALPLVSMRSPAR